MEDALSRGLDVILEIEVQGAMQIKKNFPDAVLTFIAPPSYEELEKRLRGRGTETEEKILARLEQTKNELLFADCYDYVVYNYDGMDTEAANKIISIIDAEKASVKRNTQIAKKYFENK